MDDTQFSTQQQNAGNAPPASFVNAQGQTQQFASQSSQNKQNPPPLVNLIDDVNTNEILDKDIFELMGVKNMSDDQKAQVFQQMLDTIQNRVIARIEDEIPESDREAWLTMLATKDNAKIDAFLKERNIDVKTLMIQEALIYKTEMTAMTGPLRQAEKQAHLSSTQSENLGSTSQPQVNS